MKRKIKLLSYFIFLSLLSNSCKSFKKLPATQKTIKIKDSIHRESHTIDTIVIARKADTVKLKETINKLTKEAIVKRSKHTQLSIKRVGNTIEAECIADELKELLALQKEIIRHYKEINQHHQETIIIPEKYIPELLKPLIWIGGIVLLLFLGGTIMKFVKPKIL
ncbi:hypothetical protein [Tenacibaculum jejuense]|uniref:Lipoprotein n=1 Tax=Tenacibaculum jejuense TaxID=584609 RepID=A0A238UD69_9FLAO|nr:hypothetical protein [Tenacibaculum jejuense]SNR16528.1 exported protein of unknown function [Tenacibaculum jejuense]